MTILWAGGEDIDFLNATSGNHCGYNGYFDSAYSRVSLIGGPLLSSSDLSGGEIQSGWITVRLRINPSYLGRIGLVDSNGKGILFGHSGGKLVIWKYDGSAFTALATSVSYTIIDGSLFKIDMHVVDYGASSAITVYQNESEFLTYSGDSSISGVTGFTKVHIYTSGTELTFSEIIVSDSTTIGYRLKTTAIDASGDTNEYDYGTYADINEVTINDATQIYTATANKKFLANCTGMPSGDYIVKAVKIAARCVDGTVSLGAKLGIKSGGTEDFESTPQNCSGYWQTKERLMNVNPVTGVPFTPSEIDALQLAIKSGTV